MFMSPEIVEASEYSYSSDIWSIGVVFYCLFSMNHKEINFRLNFDKKKIYIQKNIELMNYQFGKEYVDLIVRCLDVDCGNRPTAEQILTELKTLKSSLNLNKKRTRGRTIKIKEVDEKIKYDSDEEGIEFYPLQEQERNNDTMLEELGLEKFERK
jgi:serine/threonine protein kinase